MSRVLLVRHGKASDHWHDYDQLSPRGFEQAALVGKRLARDEPELRAIYHGKLRRQRETAETVRAELVDAGRPVPELTELSTLDEIAAGVVDTALLQEPDLVLRERITGWTTGQRQGDKRTFSWLMRCFTRFESGELVGDFETFTEFHGRVVATLAKLVDPAGGTTVAFSSGGFIATAAGIAVETAMNPTLQLMATLENTSLTELRWSRSRAKFRLVRLNDVGHLPPDARTTI